MISPDRVAPATVESGRVAGRSLGVLIAVPTIEVGAADEGAVELAAVLAGAGHRPVVVTNGGRLETWLRAANIDLVRLDMASRNPLVIARNAAALVHLVRARRCDIIHAHGRSAAWSAYIAARIAGRPFLTSWYKGFREQNALKRLYNSVMARGDRIITVSDQIAELIVAHHHTPSERIVVIPVGIDFDHFDPGALTAERINAVRGGWGVEPDTRVILVAGRLLRRKGHHVVVQAVRRLKNMGVRDVLFVFAGEDQGRTGYTGELWDLVLSTGTADMIRMSGPVDDLPAAYGACAAVISAATQAEGLQRSLLEGLAMARPMIVSDLAAGPDVVLSPPAVSEDRMTGLRFPVGDDAALAAAVIRLLSMPGPTRDAIGRRGREWVRAHCDRGTVASQLLAIYAGIAGGPR